MLRLIKIVFLFTYSNILLGDTILVPEQISTLINYEIYANPMDRSRAKSLVELEYFEVPAEYLVGKYDVDMIHPQILETMTFTRDGRKYVRWLINPEDTSYHLEFEKWLKLQKMDSTRRKGEVWGMKTASASFLLCGKNGYWFSGKVSTNKTGGMWQDKKLIERHLDIAFDNSYYAYKIQKFNGASGQTHVMQYDVGGFANSWIDQSMIFRDLGPAGTDVTKELVPLFSFGDEGKGPELLKRSGATSVQQMYKSILGPMMGKAMAEVLILYNFIPHAPHGQNFLVEMNKNGGPTGNVYFRDIQDMHYWKGAEENLYRGGFSLAQKYPKRVDATGKVGIGFFHGLNQLPSWVSKSGINMSEVNTSVFEAFQSEVIRGLEIPGVGNIFNSIDAISVFGEQSYGTASIEDRILKSVPDCYRNQVSMYGAL